MANEGRSWTREQVSGLAAKLQRFMDGLPEDEQRILGTILQQAADGARSGDVTGYSALKPLTADVTIFNPTPDDGLSGESDPGRRTVPLSIPLLRGW